MALTKVRGAGIDADGQELILDADGDTTLTVDTDDQIDIKIAGSDKLKIDASSHLVTTTAGTSNLVLGVNAGNSIQSGGNNNVCIGDEAGTALTTGDLNTFVGMNAGATVATHSSNTAVGAFALDAGTGTDITAIGAGALGGASYAANENTAVGKDAGNSITTAPYNALVGAYAGDGLTTGERNTVVGYDALGAEVAGNYNVAVGMQALRSQTNSSSVDTRNTAVGYQAGYNLSTGKFNTLLGSNAASGDTLSGDNNTCVGYGAGHGLTSGGNNLFLGHDAGRSTSPAGNQTTGSNTVCLGDDNIGDFFCADTSISSSDSRDKADITDFNVGLNWVKDLRPVTYKWDKRSWYGTEEEPLGTPDGSKKSSKVHIGFVAQEVLEVEKANGYADSKDTMLTCNLTEDGQRYGMKYERLVPILVNAIQELSAKNDALEARIKKLEDG